MILGPWLALVVTVAAPSRMMNNTNFPAHNIPGGGCDPNVASPHASPASCKGACDGEEKCDMWTFVPESLLRKEGEGAGASSPLCCLKSCNVSIHCPAPEPEPGVVSGVKDPSTYGRCSDPTCFDFKVDWSSGSTATTLTPGNFSVRKFEAVFYPPDGQTYAYVDVVDFSDYYYPDSYSTEVGVWSSPDGRTGWQYHGIVIKRGANGSWDGGGIASPGAAVATDGTVLVGYAGENSPSGGINRGIGLATAPHPLGPFVKSATPIASPSGICGGTRRCDDVVMQSRPGNEIHLYHSVKGGDCCPAPTGPGDGIWHHLSTDGGKTWQNAQPVLSTKLQPGTSPAESIAGKYMPGMLGGKGGMVIITDGGPGFGLHAYMSKSPGDMVNFVAAKQPLITEHPSATGMRPGQWAASQIGFVPDADGAITGVSFSLYTDAKVYSQRHRMMELGYTHTIYNFTSPPH